MAKMTLDGLTVRLQQAFGDALTAVVLYGSAARGDRVEGRSDQNVLVVVRTMATAGLRAAAVAASAWVDVGNPAPLLMTEAEWRSSRDIFAMEHADIEASHRILAGALPKLPGSVDVADLRRQLEFEAMGILIHFRQGILASAGDRRRELELLASSKSGVLVLFRGLLRVHGGMIPAAPADVVRAAAVRAGFDPSPFLEVVAHVAGTTPIAKARADAVLEAYLVGLKQFVAHVDGLVHPGRAAVD